MEHECHLSHFFNDKHSTINTTSTLHLQLKTKLKTWFLTVNTDSFKCTVLCRHMYRSLTILSLLRDELSWKKKKTSDIHQPS